MHPTPGGWTGRKRKPGSYEIAPGGKRGDPLEDAIIAGNPFGLPN